MRVLTMVRANCFLARKRREMRVTWLGVGLGLGLGLGFGFGFRLGLALGFGFGLECASPRCGRRRC